MEGSRLDAELCLSHLMPTDTETPVLPKARGRFCDPCPLRDPSVPLVVAS